MRELSDQIAYETYTRWLSNHEKSEYYRGVIGGMEMLWQNLEERVEEYKDWVRSLKADMEDENGTSSE